MKKSSLLLLDDEKNFIDTLKERLELAGYAATACYDVQQALQEIQSKTFDVAVVDLVLDDTDGVDAMRRIKAISPLTECIVLSGHGTLRMAVEAMKQGAFEFLEKPCDFHLVTQTIDEAFARKQTQDHRILNAAKRVELKLEQAMVDATFAEAGQLDKT
jgi:DNA-binding NtrC family response regulator